MKKNYFNYYFTTWAILLVIFNVIVFAVPNEVAGMSKFGGAFWAGYLFITFAFIGQLVCARIAFKADSAERFFLNLPLINISYTTLLLSMIFGTACMAIPDLPNWVGIILCTLILGFSAIALVKSSAAAELINATEAKVKEKTVFIKTLTADAQNLMANVRCDEMRTAAKKVYEAIRYSDPMSAEALEEVEAQISEKYQSFAKSAASDEIDVKKTDSLADELIALLNDRNLKCILMKQGE